MSGVDILQAIQSFSSPAADRFFSLITSLHQEAVYILILPLVYWLYDKRFARYLVSVFLLGYWANTVLKELFQTLRPSPAQVRVLGAETGTGYAFPSGHAMGPLMFWGAVAQEIRRPSFTAVTGLLIFLIGLSRLYMGLHWPLDVAGGWAIGLLLLLLLAATRRVWTGEGIGFLLQLTAAVLVPLGMVALAAGALQGELSKDIMVTGGAYLGFWVGAVLEEYLVGFDPRRGGWGLQTIKVCLGLALVLAVKEGGKLLFPADGWGDFGRYAAVGFAAVFVVPWLFSRLSGGGATGRPWRRIA